MKVKLTKDFAWCYDGITPTVIAAGTVVDSPLAENALSMKVGVQVSESYEQKMEPAAPLNKATAPELNKRKKG